MKSSPFDELYSKSMTRKEFLAYLGFLFLAVTGISGILKNLSNPKILKTKKLTQKTGFGSGPYGV